jgi:hypothetical protein
MVSRVRDEAIDILVFHVLSDSLQPPRSGSASCQHAGIPANAGIHSSGARVLGQRSWAFSQWIPASAGMTISLPCGGRSARRAR